MCLTGYTSVYNIEYICLPCKSAIYNGRIPKLSIKNNCGFPPQPDELKLYPVEERIISPLMPFMTIIELPVGGQQALKGSICHVPVDISPTVNSLPRNLEDTETVSVKIKRKKIYKGAVFSENICPNKVMKALYYLLQKSELYQMEDIHIDYDWRERLVTQEKMQENINSSEKSDAQNTDHQEDHIQGRSDTDEEVNAPSINTMLDDLHVDNNNMSLTFAPGEGKWPIFHEPLAEYICFPSIFCGQKRPSNNERTYPVQIHELFKYELRSADTRVASNIPNIFWKVKHKQIKQIADKVSLAVHRNKTKGKRITAKMLLRAQVSTSPLAHG